MRTLYNHYISDDLIFSRIPEAEREPEKEKKKTDFNFFNLFSKEKKPEEKEKNAGISGILKRFHLEDIDAGDILLFLILIFLIIEGDNWELAIILGLVLFLSLRSDEETEDIF